MHGIICEKPRKKIENNEKNGKPACPTPKSHLAHKLPQGFETQTYETFQCPLNVPEFQPCHQLEY